MSKHHHHKDVKAHFTFVLDEKSGNMSVVNGLDKQVTTDQKQKQNKTKTPLLPMETSRAGIAENNLLPT